jgi:hypothetical protein
MNTMINRLTSVRAFAGLVALLSLLGYLKWGGIITLAVYTPVAAVAMGLLVAGILYRFLVGE